MKNSLVYCWMSPVLSFPWDYLPCGFLMLSPCKHANHWCEVFQRLMFTALNMLMYILREEKDENLEVVLSDSEVIIILGQLREKHCHIGCVWISCQPNNCLNFAFQYSVLMSSMNSLGIQSLSIKVIDTTRWHSRVQVVQVVVWALSSILIINIKRHNQIDFRR